jgi:RNA polymerase sigma-70 factor, ECF subfamily
MPVTSINHKTGELNVEFETLFCLHKDLMFRAAYSVTGNPHDAEDAVQNVFMRLIRQGIPNIQYNAASYFYKAGINEALHIVRTRRRHGIDDDDERAPEPSNDGSPLEADMFERLRDALPTLPDRDVELLILAGWGYTDSEIAKLTDRTRGFVAVSLHRARARLKKKMFGNTGGQQ